MIDPGSAASPEPSTGVMPGSDGGTPAEATAAATPGAPGSDATPDAVAESLGPGGSGLPFGRPSFLHLPRSRRGLLALALALGALATAVVFGSAAAIQWTETADFCGRCHQMGPELAAYDAGPHNEVSCGECHVEPGVAGWIKSKVNGTRQLLQVITGLYPQPVPPPDHANLPPVQDSCIRCHSLSRLQTATLKTRTQFSEDEKNTRQFVGLMIRPGGGDVFDVGRSVHWHVLRDVEYRSAEPNASTIDWVGVVGTDGTIEEYIAQKQVTIAEDVAPDVGRIAASEKVRRMDCLDCHNRVGHNIPNPRRAIDIELVEGRIDSSLPYIKREAMRILWADYSSVTAADAEAERLRSFYQARYPLVYAEKASLIEQAINEIKMAYRQTATPEMKVSARTYPDNMGHTDFPGCFRCHDGGHFLVKDGAVTAETIPSTCDTCHTYPQIGPAVASLPLGAPPDSHRDPVWVFNHRRIAPSLDPGGTACGECHARDYCVNCHSTGAVTVDHDEMLTNHAAVIRKSGNQACAYCHQPIYCARCHADPVLPGSQPLTQGGSTGSVPPGLRSWLATAGSGP